jgi:hypothetical protein
MTLLLRHPATGLFCGDAFQWVRDVKYARTFETQEAARQWMTSRGLPHVEIVLSNGDAAQSPPTLLTPAKAAF